MVQIGEAVTLKKTTTGETMKGKVTRTETIVKLDKPILINGAGYQDIITEVKFPSDIYEIVSSGGKRRTKKQRKHSKKSRKHKK